VFGAGPCYGDAIEEPNRVLPKDFERFVAMNDVIVFLACVAVATGVVLLSIDVVFRFVLPALDRRAAMRFTDRDVTFAVIELPEAWVTAAGSVERAQVLARFNFRMATYNVNAAAFQAALERKSLGMLMRRVEGLRESRLDEAVVDPELSLMQMFELEKFQYSMDSVLPV
jgi:hypothetical protein